MAEIVILSGAGLSAESGLKTFRDSDGLWENYSVEEVCSVQGFLRNPKKVNDFYDERRAQLKGVSPNLAHFMIGEMKRTYGDLIAVLTQNVDDLLERAWCEDVIHLHGTLTDLRCQECGCVFECRYEKQAKFGCPNCHGSQIRHNVVMFGEAAPKYSAMYEHIAEAKLLICIGTSGAVIDVGYFARKVKFSILNNLESSHLDAFFTKCYIQKATAACESIERDIQHFVKFGKIEV